MPQVPFVSLFPETSQGNSARSHKLRRLPHPSPAAQPRARRMRLRRAGTVARARETVRVPRARAWPRGRFSLTMDRFPPPSNVSLRESRKRIRATSGFFEGLGGGGGEK